MIGFGIVRNATAVLVLVFLSSIAYAQDSKVDIGLRANVLLGDGIPNNDVLGLGFASVSVDDASGSTDTGGTFDLTFDAGNEIHLMGTLGTSYNFSKRWSTSFAARVEHHFMDVLITDRVTGATAKIDAETYTGAYLSLNYRF